MGREAFTIPLEEYIKINNINRNHKNQFTGLTSEEVSRLSSHQKNRNRLKLKTTLIDVYRIIKEPINVVMISSGIAMVILYSIFKEEHLHIVVGVFVFIVLVFNILVELYHQEKIDRIILKSNKTHKCKVLREERVVEIDRADIVVGDIMVCDKNDLVCADGRIIEVAGEVRVSTMALTGRNNVISKGLASTSSKLNTTENVLLEGSLILNGKAKARVLAAGENTVLEKMKKRVHVRDKLDPALYNDISIFFNGCLGMATALGAVSLIIGLIIDIKTVYLIDSIISIYVAFLPEGIPAIIKLLLYETAQKLKDRGVIVQDLDAITALGPATAICMSPTKLCSEREKYCEYVYDGKYLIDLELEIATFDPFNKEEIDDNLLYIENVSKCFHRKGKRRKRGDIDSVLELFSDSVKALKEKRDKGRAGKRTKRVIYGIFDDKYRAVLVHNDEKTNSSCHGDRRESLGSHGRNSVYICTSNPEIIGECSWKSNDDERFNEKMRSELLHKFQKNHKLGYDVIILAEKTCRRSKRCLEFIKEIGRRRQRKTRRLGLNFLAFMIIAEVPKPDAELTVNLLESAGVSLYLCDQCRTEKSIRILCDVMCLNCHEIDVASKKHAMNKEPGYALAMDKSDFCGLDPEDGDAVKRIYNKIVIGRARPKNMRDIVLKLQEGGNDVIYFGNTIQDCDSLCTANIGITTDRAAHPCKKYSQLVLPDDSLEGIIFGIEEGRLFLINLRKAIRYIMMSATPQLVAIIFFLFFGTPMYNSPILLLFQNYLVNIIPAIFFAYEKPELNIIVQDDFKDFQIQPGINDSDFVMIRYLKRFRDILSPRRLYTPRVLIYSLVEVGLISSAAAILTFYISLSFSGIPSFAFFFSHHEFFHLESPDVISTDDNILTPQDQVDALYRARCSYFVVLLISQLGNLFTCRKTENFCFSKLQDSLYLIFSSIIGVFVSIVVIYIPFFEDFLLIKKPDLISYAMGFGSAFLILLLDTLKKIKIQKHRNRE